MATDPAPEPPSAADIEAFDSFPWSKQKVFLLGLVETLGGQPALFPDPRHEGNAAFCRTVFYRQKTGRRIDLTHYQLYRSSHPDYPSVDRRLLRALYAAAKEVDAGVEESTAQAPSFSRRIAEAVAAAPLINPFDGTPTPPIRDTVPLWQRTAPKSRLQVEKEATAPVSTTTATPDEAPYSDKFAQIVEAIQSGKELEGIRQIPDTVLRQPGVVPLGKLTAPRKPWERDGDAATSASSTLSFLTDDTSSPKAQQTPLGGVDLEFPPPVDTTLTATDGEADAQSKQQADDL